MTTRRRFLVTLLGSALAAPLVTKAQQANKVYRIGYLAPGLGIEGREVSFRQGLREHGYVEGKNIEIDWRFAKGRIDQFSVLAAELVRLKPDCVLALGVDAIRALTRLTSTIPIVMGTIDADPVQEGFVASLAKPGGNVTGFTGIAWELAGKRLELLRDVAPKASRVAILFDPRSPASHAHVKETVGSARALGIQLQLLEATDLQGLEKAFRAAREARTQALFVIGTGMMMSHRPRVIAFAAEARLPAIYSNELFVGDGGLMTYGTDLNEQFRRAAAYVDKILKGARPGDLPVQQPTKFELVINLKAAKQIGLTIPRSILARADRVIE